MEDMSMKTNEIVEVEDDTEVEETSEHGGYGVLLLVAAAGAVAGHFIEKGLKAAWRWGKGKIDEHRLKKAGDEATPDDGETPVEESKS